jgi:hypothetical protein
MSPLKTSWLRPPCARSMPAQLHRWEPLLKHELAGRVKLEIFHTRHLRAPLNIVPRWPHAAGAAVSRKEINALDSALQAERARVRNAGAWKRRIPGRGMPDAGAVRELRTRQSAPIPR